MPAQADHQALLANVEGEVAELERLCETLEKKLLRGEWAGAAEALQDARKTTHGFLNAMEAAGEVRTEAFDLAVHARIQRVLEIRNDQLKRLETFRDDVGQRLRALSQWNGFARAVGAKHSPPNRGVALDRTQ